MFGMNCVVSVKASVWFVVLKVFFLSLCLFFKRDHWWNECRNGKDGLWHLCDQTSRCKCWSGTKRYWHHSWRFRCLSDSKMLQCLCPNCSVSSMTWTWAYPFVLRYTSEFIPDGAWLGQSFSENIQVLKNKLLDWLLPIAALLLPCVNLEVIQCA